MGKKIFLIMIVLALVFLIGGVSCYKILNPNDAPATNRDIAVSEMKPDSDIVEIPLDSVKGITQQEAEELCHLILGEKDEETGFIFSFGTSGAVETQGKQYYVIRASWLVDNSHLSYIGDFFVSADGKEMYDGTAFQGEYIMEKVIWRE
ncbi:MAG: hypothetical protein IKW06_04980 [Clostridia bacterium]|nr:hypothetical protein [Clostridia bacterium]